MRKKMFGVVRRQSKGLCRWFERERVCVYQVAKFDAAGMWEDAWGGAAPLHCINPVRVAYIEARLAAVGAQLQGANVVDASWAVLFWALVSCCCVGRSH